MKMKTVLILIVLFLLKNEGLIAQVTGRNIHQTISFKSKFIQIKDVFNYGLVNNGLNLGGEYSLVSITESSAVIYKAEVDFGVNYNQGLGLNWSFKPLDLFYGFRLNKNPEIPVILGPYISGYYKWQLYPELQSGKMFWQSSYELGPRLMFSLPYKRRMFSFSFSNSIAGFISRPEAKTEEYFYSLTMADFIRNPHSNMTFGFQNVYNHFNVILEMSDRNKKLSINYEFEYMDYLNAPAFKYLSHSINLKWKIGNNKMK